MQLLNNPESETKLFLQTLLKQQHKDLIFEPIPVKGYELVVKITNRAAKLCAIVSIHNTALGPSLGGIRIHPYASFDAALNDVLRLSEAMTYKAAMIGAGLGGGKSVIIANPHTDKTLSLLNAFAEAVNSLKGRYICAEDSGCSVEDARQISKRTKFVVGLPHQKSSGNPSPFTAWGTFLGIQAVVERLTGSKNLQGKKIAVQGLGNVGFLLIEYLYGAGAELIVADRAPSKVRLAVTKYKAKSVSQNEILFSECDVLAPCALGGVIHEKNIPGLKCKAIAGCANNQLLNPAFDADRLKNRGILYAPDFVINAGGLLNVASEIEPEGYQPNSVIAKLHEIADRLAAIFEISEKNNVSTYNAARSLAQYRLRYGIGKRSHPPIFHHSL